MKSLRLLPAVALLLCVEARAQLADETQITPVVPGGRGALAQAR